MSAMKRPQALLLLLLAATAFAGDDDFPTYRDSLRAALAKVQGKGDAFVTLSAKGPPPVGWGIGDPVYGDISACTAAPAYNLPLLADRGLPMGIQLLGQPHEDYELGRVGRWLSDLFLGD